VTGTEVDLFLSPGVVDLETSAGREFDDLFADLPPELERDQYKRPLIEPPPGGWADPDNPRWIKDQKRYGGRRPYMRASTAAALLDNGAGLAIWKGRHIALQVGRALDLAAILAGLRYTKEDFPTIDRMIEECLVRGAQEEASLSAANWGTAVHRFAEPNSPPRAPEKLAPDVKAYRREMDNHGIVTLETEVFVVNDELGIAGTFDELDQLSGDAPLCPTAGYHSVRWCTTEMAEHPEDDEGFWYCTECPREPVLDGVPPQEDVLIADKKTGKLHLLGQSIQLAIYANSLRYDVGTGHRRPIHSRLSLYRAILAHIPLGKGSCNLWEVDIAEGYRLARLAFKVNEARRNEKKLFKLMT